MTRAEHVEWCKERALEYVDAGKPAQGIDSLFSDLRKHPETEDHGAIELGTMLRFAGHLETAQQAREFIVGVQ